jgi:hypothetical protein
MKCICIHVCLSVCGGIQCIQFHMCLSVCGGIKCICMCVCEFDGRCKV